MAKVLVIDNYAKNFLNFRGSFVVDMVNRGHEVIVALPDADPDIVQTLEQLGITSKVIHLERARINPIADLRSFFSMLTLIRDTKPDTLILYQAKVIIYGALVGWLAQVKSRFATINGLGYGFITKSLKGRMIALAQRILYRISLRFCHVILFQNSDDRDLFRALGLIGKQSRVAVVNGSGVNVTRFSPTPLPDAPVFLMVGRILVNKGVREYFEAAKIVRRIYPAARFLLVGWLDTENPDSLSAAEFDALLQEQNVEFLGRLADVRPAISQCSVFVLPSYREGTPRSVLEALAMGRPIVTSDAPGCRETVINGKNGFLVPVADAPKLADAIMRFISDPKLSIRLGVASRILAEEKYDVAKVNHSIFENFHL